MHLSDLLPKIRAEVYMNIAFLRRGGSMSKRKYSEVEMIGALKQMEAGRSAAEVGRELGVSKHTVYAWKAKYGGMSVGEAQRLRQLEDENGRLKKLVADLSLDKDMLKAVIEKNGWSS
jgi:putative transposase